MNMNSIVRRGERWTPDERDQLMILFSEGYELDEIAQLHQRTKFAIECQLKSQNILKKDIPFKRINESNLQKNHIKKILITKLEHLENDLQLVKQLLSQL